VNVRSPLADEHSGRRNGALSFRPFRRLWIALSLSSLGDWLSLLALSTLASTLGGAGSSGLYAVSGVWLTSLLPALLFGPLAGAIADRFDRRSIMIAGDVVRAVLYLSIPLNLTLGVVDKLTWLYVAQFLASCASLFWTPAKDASVPNLVPADRLEQANQFSLFTTYGTAPVAGLLFALLSLVSRGLGSVVSPYFATNQVDLALYFNVLTFVVSALTVISLQIPRHHATGQDGQVAPQPSVARSIWEGWRFLGANKIVRGIVIGMTGAFAAGGVVVGLGPSYIENTLSGGGAGWGVVFSAIFLGLAAGMFLGLHILHGFSRRRLFGLSIAFAAVPLALIAIIPNLVITAFLVLLLGASAGIAYVTGYTIVGLEVDDDTRGRTFSFLQSGVRVILFAVIAIAPSLAGGLSSLVHAITGGQNLRIAHVTYNSVGDNLVLLLAAVVALALGRAAYRQMDNRRGMPLLPDLLAALRREDAPAEPGVIPPRPAERRGLLLALEGGEGAGKSTQARLLAIWLRDQGFDVVATHEPGATKVGMRLRALLLDNTHAGLAPRAETLMYAADRAEHVAAVIAPAMERGAVVVTDRYVDSSLAYQGAGRQLALPEVIELNNWATGGLLPDLTILLDLPPAEGLGRRTSSRDRLESEPTEFHQRVRTGFLARAAADPGRYLVLDGTRQPGDLSREIQDRVRSLLPDPVPMTAEEITGSFPAVRD
jgi:dTMP kinase